MPGTSSHIGDAFRFIRTLTFLKVWNYCLIQYSYLLGRISGRPSHLGMPMSISVEPTTSCNLRCPECPSGLRQFSRPQGKLKIEAYQDLIDQLSKKLMYLILYFQGEPLLNPAFFEMAAYAKTKGIYTATSTNGHFLNDENARKSVESGLDRMIISLDGIDQETYENYRKGGELEKVLQGIQNVVRWKKELKSSTPFLIVQFLVFRKNEHQIPGVKELVKELGVDKLELKSAQVYNFENDTELIPENPKYARYVKDGSGQWKLKKSVRNRCFRMWSGAVITWDGRVVPCCFDKDAIHQLGNLETHSFKEIWNNNAYAELRKQLFTDRNKVDICQNCTE